MTQKTTMTRKFFNIKTALIGGSLIFASCNQTHIDTAPTPAHTAGKIDKSAAENPPPNIIIILTDDQGYMDVGFNGGLEIPTPNIDRIAHEGVRFTRGYVSHPTCGPSRAGLLTGRYQGHFGFFQNPNNDPRDPNAGIPLSQRLLPQLVSGKGYRSIAIGKWHVGSHESLRPLKRGFDEFFGFLSGSHHYFADKFVKLDDLTTAEKPRVLHKTWLRRGDSPVKTSGYITDLFSDEAAAFITRNQDNPFLIYLAYNAPHVPLEASEKYLSRFAHIKDKKRRTYAAMVSAVDDGVGTILNKLDETGLDRNTIVFFLSDNGGIVSDEKQHPDYTKAFKRSTWNGSDNGALRAGKGTMFEGGIRVPFAMRWRGEIPSGLTYDKPVSSLDIAATITGVNNIDTDIDLSGVNLLPYLKGETSSAPHEHLMFRQVIVPNRRRFALVDENGKKFHIDERKDKSEQLALYDLRADISETQNLISKEDTAASDYERAIKNWAAQMPSEHASTTSSIKWRIIREPKDAAEKQ